MKSELTDKERETIVEQYHRWVVDCIMDAFVFPLVYLAALVGLAFLVEKLWLK